MITFDPPLPRNFLCGRSYAFIVRTDRPIMSITVTQTFPKNENNNVEQTFEGRGRTRMRISWETSYGYGSVEITVRTTNGETFTIPIGYSD